MKKVDWLNWESSILDIYNIEYIKNPEDIPDNVLWSSRCSRTKTGKDNALPNEFYVSAINLGFYKYCEKNGFRYGILSDLYGVHFDDERLDFYDIHPTALTMERKKELGIIIRNKCRKRNYSKIIYYNSGPIMSKPYFDMLYYSGLKAYFITKLPNLNPKLKGIL